MSSDAEHRRGRECGDAVRQDSGLQGEIGVFVVGVAARSAKRALEGALVAKLIGGLRGRTADDRRIELKRIGVEQ